MIGGLIENSGMGALLGEGGMGSVEKDDVSVLGVERRASASFFCFAVCFFLFIFFFYDGGNFAFRGVVLACERCEECRCSCVL